MPRERPPAEHALEVQEVVEMGEPKVEAEEQEERWARLLPELLSEVVRRVEASGGERWPARKDVVSCAGVCRRWRDAAVAVVRPPAVSGKITLPSSLKQVRTGATSGRAPLSYPSIGRGRCFSASGLVCGGAGLWKSPIQTQIFRRTRDAISPLSIRSNKVPR
jgi:hypothetical protein